MLQRLIQVKDAVMDVCGAHFDCWKRKKKYIEKATAVQMIVGNTEWWEKITALCEIIAPCISVMRMCDGNTPAVGKIYYDVVQMGIQLNEALSSEALEACVPLNTKSSVKILLQNRWADM